MRGWGGVDGLLTPCMSRTFGGKDLRCSECGWKGLVGLGYDGTLSTLVISRWRKTKFVG